MEEMLPWKACASIVGHDRRGNGAFGSHMHNQVSSRDSHCSSPWDQCWITSSGNMEHAAENRNIQCPDLAADQKHPRVHALGTERLSIS